MECRLVATGEKAGQLMLLETNSFRHINHLTLRFVAPTDIVRQEYLSQLVLQYKNNSIQLQKRVQQLELQCDQESQQMNGDLKHLQKQIGSLQQQHKHEIDQIMEQHRQSLESEKARWQSEQNRLIAQTAKDLLHLSQDHQSAVSKLQQQCTEHDHRYQTLELKYQEATSKLESTQAQLVVVQDDFQRLSQLQLQIQRESDEHERVRRDLEIQYEQLKKAHETTVTQVSERDNTIRSLNAQIDHLTSEKQNLDQSFRSLKQDYATLQSTNTTTCQDLQKSNEIISKMQTDLRSLKSKIKLKNTVTVEQERKMEEMTTELEKRKTSLDGLQHEKLEWGKDKILLEQKIQQLQSQSDEQLKAMNDNKNGESFSYIIADDFW
jgi:spindle assembly abnormal protein 6